jgi:hypothetical protein
MLFFVTMLNLYYRYHKDRNQDVSILGYNNPIREMKING